MNDFTKDELNIILAMCANDCNYIIRDVSKLSQSEGTELVREFYVGMLKQLHSIRIKIKSLIDNYCEHQWEEDRHHMDIYLCPKCGKREWWENK